jgi:hypothetical protein
VTSRTPTAARAASGVACLALALLALLLARDAWRVESALRAGDSRARLSAAGDGAWSAETTLPSGAVRRLLGVGDDLEFRSAIVAGRAARERPASDADVRRRLPAKAALLHAENDSDDVRAAAAANLLGVLYSTDPDDPDRSAAVKAYEEFAKAVRLDPDNEAAKLNLELVLHQQDADRLRGRKGSASGERPGQSGAGRRAGGHGY